MSTKDHSIPMTRHPAGYRRPGRRTLALVAGLLLPGLALATTAGGCPGVQAEAAVGDTIILDICAGDGQQAVTGAPFPQPLVVRLRQAVLPTATSPASTVGTPVDNVPIHFEVIPAPNGAAATPAEVQVETDADGMAAATLQANSVPGTYRVRVQAQGKGPIGNAVEFTLHNLSGGTIPPGPAVSVPALSASGLLGLVLGVLLLLSFVVQRR